jgi:hypothetical protein
MKVLCIDTRNPKHPHLLKPEHYIHEGHTYTVCGSYFDKRDSHEYYYLVERQMKPLTSYRASRFVPLSDIDEAIILREGMVVSDSNSRKISVPVKAVVL